MTKYYFVFGIIIVFGLIGCSSSEKIVQLESRIGEIEHQLKYMTEEAKLLRETNKELLGLLNKIEFQKLSNEQTIQAQSPTTTKVEPNLNPTQCQAITLAGVQCSRNSSPGSKYCWQHQSSSSEVKSSSSNSTYNNKTIITGPRGGQYYINKNGNKTYIRKKK